MEREQAPVKLDCDEEGFPGVWVVLYCDGTPGYIHANELNALREAVSIGGMIRFVRIMGGDIST